MVFVGVYRAIYDYLPQSEEELEIKDGDLLFVLEKSTEDDWWKCKKKAVSDDDDEPEGLVPNNYVEEVPPSHQAKALYDYTKQTDEELSFKEDTRLDVYDDTDPDWTLVGAHGEFGFAPAIYIEVLSSSSTAPSIPAAPPLPATTQTRELAPPPMPARPVAADEPIPGEADYPGPGASAAEHNPASALASIIAQKTGGAQPSPAVERALASPPLPSRPQYAEESEEEAPPPKPKRPESSQLSSPTAAAYTSPRLPEPPGVVASPPRIRVQPTSNVEEQDGPLSPGGYHMYNIHEVVSHMGKNKKMPTTLGINAAKGTIMISPEKSRDGPSKEWTAEKLTHYSIEGKHVFVELVRPSKSVDFHAGAKDTAQEIVAHLGELAGMARAEGLREVIAAGSGGGGNKKGKMLYEFMAQGDDEVTVAVDDEVIILDDAASDEWWKVRRLKNGKEGVVPSSYVEITGTVPVARDSAVDAARSTVEQNRLEEQRLAKEALKKPVTDDIPQRNSSLMEGSDSKRASRSDKRSGKEAQPKSKPNSTRVRTWTDRSGTFKVEAEFIGLREGKIHLHKLNGVKIAVPVAKMAVEDLEYVERATGASLDEDKPLSDIKRRSTLRQNGKANGRPTAGASVQPVEQYDWFDFFLQCGVNPQICERYAGAFSKDQMSPEILPQVNEQLLRTLGLKEGDILRVMKHLDEKYDRKRPDPDSANGSAGGLFSGPGGALRNNTRKGRPAPAVQTNDIVDGSAFKQTSDDAGKPLAGDATATPLTSAPARKPTNGFDDDAWDVKPSRTQTPTERPSATPEPPKTVEPPKPKINDDIASLAISQPALQPTPAAQPSEPPTQQPQVNLTASAPQPTKPQGADQAIFEKIAALAPQPPGQRPAPPAQIQSTATGIPPPPRAASAPGFNPQQSQSGFGPPLLQPQLTGYQPQYQPNMQGLAPMPTGFQPQQGFMQQNTMMPQPTGLQAIQQNYPAMQPQPTGFQPQMQQQSYLQSQPTGYGGFNQAQPTGYGQPSYQQQLMNGTQTGSPFADPPRQPFQPTPSGLSNSFSPNVGYQPQFNISQPTGMNGFGAQATHPGPPQLPPQQTGGVFGPSQPVAAPLVPQKTGPPPPVRFGVTPGAKPLMPQPTGRANLAKATPQNPFGF